MYPNGELARLSERKRILQARIDVHRWECAVAAATLSRPVAMIDRGIATWQRIGPVVKLLAIPVGIMLTRFFTRRRRGKPVHGKPGKVAAVMAALPMVLRAVKTIAELRAGHAARSARKQATATAAD